MTQAVSNFDTRGEGRVSAQSGVIACILFARLSPAEIRKYLFWIDAQTSMFISQFSWAIIDIFGLGDPAIQFPLRISSLRQQQQQQ